MQNISIGLQRRLKSLNAIFIYGDLHDVGGGVLLIIVITIVAMMMIVIMLVTVIMIMTFFM